GCGGGGAARWGGGWQKDPPAVWGLRFAKKNALPKYPRMNPAIKDCTPPITRSITIIDAQPDGVPLVSASIIVATAPRAPKIAIVAPAYIANRKGANEKQVAKLSHSRTKRRKP